MGLKKCLDKEHDATRSGAAAGKTNKCRFYNELQFLRDHISNIKTHSNLVIQATANPKNIDETSTALCDSSFSPPPPRPLSTPSRTKELSRTNSTASSTSTCSSTSMKKKASGNNPSRKSKQDTGKTVDQLLSPRNYGTKRE